MNHQIIKYKSYYYHCDDYYCMWLSVIISCPVLSCISLIFSYLILSFLIYRYPAFGSMISTVESPRGTSHSWMPQEMPEEARSDAPAEPAEPASASTGFSGSRVHGARAMGRGLEPDDFHDAIIIRTLMRIIIRTVVFFWHGERTKKNGDSRKSGVFGGNRVSVSKCWGWK